MSANVVFMKHLLDVFFFACERGSSHAANPCEENNKIQRPIYKKLWRRSGAPQTLSDWGSHVDNSPTPALKSSKHEYILIKHTEYIFI